MLTTFLFMHIPSKSISVIQSILICFYQRKGCTKHPQEKLLILSEYHQSCPARLAAAIPAQNGLHRGSTELLGSSLHSYLRAVIFWVLLNISSERLKVNIPLGTGVAMQQVHWHWFSIATIKPHNLFPEENKPLLQGRWFLMAALGPMACKVICCIIVCSFFQLDSSDVPLLALTTQFS